MKAKLVLTKEQVDLLAGVEEKILRAKFEKDLISIRKKYECVEIDLQTQIKQEKKSKLTDEIFNKYLSEGMTVKEIGEITGYNEGYIYKIQKRILTEKKKTNNNT
jgi:hypothetical protein